MNENGLTQVLNVKWSNRPTNSYNGPQCPGSVPYKGINEFAMWDASTPESITTCLQNFWKTSVDIQI